MRFSRHTVLHWRPWEPLGRGSLMCTTGPGHCPCHVRAAERCPWPPVSSPPGGALSAGAAETLPADATPHPPLKKKKTYKEWNKGEYTNTPLPNICHNPSDSRLKGQDLEQQHENTESMLRHASLVGARLTLLWKSKVDHLRRDGRAQVEISKNIFQWFVCFYGRVGGVAQYLLSEESHNGSNQKTWLEKKKIGLITGTNVTSCTKCFPVPVIQS